MARTTQPITVTFRLLGAPVQEEFALPVVSHSTGVVADVVPGVPKPVSFLISNPNAFDLVVESVEVLSPGAGVVAAAVQGAPRGLAAGANSVVPISVTFPADGDQNVELACEVVFTVSRA